MSNRKAMHTITPAMMVHTMVHTAFQNRERGFFHTSHEDESAPFFLMVNGETERMLEAMHSLWKPEGTGKLSENPLQNVRYLFVATVTRACRFCIQGGMDPTDAYNASDLYIRSRRYDDILFRCHARGSPPAASPSVCDPRHGLCRGTSA